MVKIYGVCCSFLSLVSPYAVAQLAQDILRSDKFSFRLKIRDVKSEIWCERWRIGGLRSAKKSQMSARYAARSNIASSLGAVNCSSFRKETAAHVHTHGKHIESFLYCENSPAKYGIVRGSKRLETDLAKRVKCFRMPRPTKLYELCRSTSNVQRNDRKSWWTRGMISVQTFIRLALNYMGIISKSYQWIDFMCVFRIFLVANNFSLLRTAFVNCVIIYLI